MLSQLSKQASYFAPFSLKKKHKVDQGAIIYKDTVKYLHMVELLQILYYIY